MRQSFRAATHHKLTIPCILWVLIMLFIHKKFFKAGNFNVNERPDLLYFSIWGVYSKTYQKHNLLPVKTDKTLCASSRRLVWWNVIHSTKIRVVLLALKAKGQKKYWMPLVLCRYPWHSYTCITVSQELRCARFSSNLYLYTCCFNTYSTMHFARFRHCHNVSFKLSWRSRVKCKFCYMDLNNRRTGKDHRDPQLWKIFPYES